MAESLVLFSGGIDSTTALYWALGRFEGVQALTFDYGQRHRIEIRLSRRLTRRLQVPQEILRIDLRQVGGSSLTDERIPIPESDQPPRPEDGILSTYVPFRNGIFLSLAAAWADARGFEAIICGFNVIDSPNYPDTRSTFVSAMEKAINLGTRSGFEGKKIKILAPLVMMRKSEIIRLGLSLGADYSFSVSCYSGQEVPCFKCPACLTRQQAFKEAARKDPLLLRLEKEGKL